jgi:uncharacterized protein (TIGR02145 family)
MKNRFILVLITLALFPLYIHSQSSNLVQPQRKIALVIGNGSYLTSELANPENDARAMTEVLTKLGFVVYKYENLTQSQMKSAIDEFGMKLNNYDIGIFYYAGHGIQSNGFNYLIPVDAQLNIEKQVEYDCVQVDRILAYMEASGTKVNIIILDACRNNPFERSWTRSSNGKGLAFMNAPKGSLIAYATSPGSTASDGSGENGLYTSAILESIQIPNITVLQMFQNVRSIVLEKSNKQQTPWESTSLIGDFYFKKVEIIDTKNQLKVDQNSENMISNMDSYVFFIDLNDGRRYRIVTIGEQTWMAENLRSTVYNDGTDIPLISDSRAWSKLSTPGICWYGNNETLYRDIFGTIFNGYAVNTGKVCPTGWHVPNDDEWKMLATYLGGSEIAGGKLKETGTSHWISPNYGATNESEFRALPGGSRNQEGDYIDRGLSSAWWSRTKAKQEAPYYYTQNLVFRGLSGMNANFFISNFPKNVGLYVRCIKD